jgi:hypothetical protein
MLNKECRDGERDDQDSLIAFGQCHGYIQGVYDAGKVLDTATDKRQWNGGWTACVPDGVPSAGQLKEVVKKWLREHPADWHSPPTTSWLGPSKTRFPAADLTFLNIYTRTPQKTAA